MWTYKQLCKNNHPRINTYHSMSTYNTNVTMFKVKLVPMTTEVHKLAATV